MAAAPVSRQGRAYRPDEVEALLRRALTDLMADGTHFADLSVERLVSTAGMARSTFYVYFEDKATMLQTLAAGSLSRMYAAQRSWIRKGREVTREDVRDGMRKLAVTFLEDEAVMRAVAEASVSEAAIRDSYVSGVRDYARAIERFIRRGQSEGWVRDVGPADTANVLAWMTERAIMQLTPGASPRRLDGLADALADVVCATLFVEAAGAANQRPARARAR